MGAFIFCFEYLSLQQRPSDTYDSIEDTDGCMRPVFSITTPNVAFERNISQEMEGRTGKGITPVSTGVSTKLVVVMLLSMCVVAGFAIAVLVMAMVRSFS